MDLMMRTAGATLLTACLLGPAALPAAARGHHHGTCGSFCRQAGGLGGSPAVAPCHVVGQVIHVNSGVASVTVRCLGRHTSRGAVVIYPHNTGDSVDDGIPRGSYAGVDLAVRPHHTVTFRIMLSPKAQALLQRRHSLRVDLLIELKGNPVQANSQTRRLALGS
jgi:hypothetical protein